MTIGLLGRLSRSGWEGKAADQIPPLPAADPPGEALGALIQRRAIYLKPLLGSPYTWAFAGRIGPAMNFWRWGTGPGLIPGWPDWILYYWLLSAGPTAALFRWMPSPCQATAPAGPNPARPKRLRSSVASQRPGLYPGPGEDS